MGSCPCVVILCMCVRRQSGATATLIYTHATLMYLHDACYNTHIFLSLTFCRVCNKEPRNIKISLALTADLMLLSIFILAGMCRGVAGTYQGTRRCMPNITTISPKPTGIIAVGITGISRGLQYTLPSIRKHVFKVLEEHNFAYDVLWSTVSNPYFFEHRMDEFEVQKMQPCLFSIEPQEIVKHTRWKMFCETRGFICRDGLVRNIAGKVYGPGGLAYTRMDRRHFGKYVTPRLTQLKNYMCGFDSQSRLAHMIRTRADMNQFSYDAVLVIRPDVAFIRDIDLPQKFPSILTHSSHIWIPDFQEFDGLNDRAAFGGQEIMLKYLERGDVFMVNNSYHFSIAEDYLKKYVRDFGMTVQPSSMRFLRIRPVEIDGVDTGIIDGFDVMPEYMNLGHDESDLQRCAGKNWIDFKQNKVKKIRPLQC